MPTGKSLFDAYPNHRVDVETSADGPLMKIQAIPILGHIKIHAAET